MAASYGFFELMQKNTLPPEKQRELSELAVESAAVKFQEYESEFAGNSRRLASILKDEIEEGTIREDLYRLINDEFEFWGVSLFREHEIWLWDEFSDLLFRNLADSTEQVVQIRRRNNVTFLVSQMPFFAQVQDSLRRFDLFTTSKIKQENFLPIGTTSEINPSDIFQSDFDYPVYFSFFDGVPDKVQVQAILSTQSSDSVGLAYTFADGHAQYQQKKEQQHQLFQSVFVICFIILGMLLLISFASSLDVWEALLLRTFSIFAAWLLLSNVQIGTEWNLIFDQINSSNTRDLQLVINYCLDTLFILLVTLSFFNTFLNKAFSEFEKNLKLNPAWNVVIGFITFLLFYFYITDTYQLFVESTVSVMDLHVFPPLDTFSIYIASGIFSFSLIILTCFSCWYLLKNTQIEWWISLILMIIGFTLGMYSLQFFTVYEEAISWIFLACSLFYLVILLFSIAIYLNPFTLFHTSRLRLLLLLGFVSVTITYISIFMGNTERLNNQMLQAAESFVEEEASEAERIARTLLTELEDRLTGLTVDDVQQRPDYFNNIFLQQTQNVIREEWERFSISTQFVSDDGDIISEYTSDLDSPAWTRAFNMLSLIIPFEAERIRINNIRPVIRERPLNETNANYSSFRRGWIPLHENNDRQQRVGWILCSVYRERPQFEKPLRAVIAAEGNENWNSSINVTEFIDGQAARRSIVGIPLELPGYIRLPVELIETVKRDSIYIQTTDFGNEKVRELFVAANDKQIFRAATSYTDIDNHLFAVLRYFFCILISGLLLLAALAGTRTIKILDHNRRFRDRLIDRFILASLICLVLLTITSYYAIKNQNEKNIRTELLDKVSNLAESLTLQQPAGGQSVFSLVELSSALDSDASLYRNATLDISTSPQIYSQHLLPEMLPWEVYNSIYNRGNNQVTKIITLGNQQLLIGFQPWLDEAGNIAGVVAIPTFLEAPKFNEQILSTTSYLLGFYVLVFSLFIVGASIISTQLTAPLYSIRKGLKKISGGNLETLLPVQSKDEIGSLTNAYNIMVYRLKELQQELSRAEREAAWKEMAQQVAHEIKNPLTPMKLNLQHLERQLKMEDADFSVLKPKIHKITASLIEQIESLNQIASEFSTFAKPIQQQFERFNFNEIVESVIELYSSDESVSLTTKLWPGQLPVLGAKDELRRAVINLVKNAYEAMPEGGEIVLKTEFEEKQGIILLYVKDTGEGIPDEDKARIFVPNFSTKTSGTGLGLAITKKIIEEHNGRISFNSEKGKGTIFTVSIPHADEGKPSL